jgi:hypothetical protein
LPAIAIIFIFLIFSHYFIAITPLFSMAAGKTISADFRHYTFSPFIFATLRFHYARLFDTLFIDFDISPLIIFDIEYTPLRFLSPLALAMPPLRCFLSFSLFTRCHAATLA